MNTVMEDTWTCIQFLQSNTFERWTNLYEPMIITEKGLQLQSLVHIFFLLVGGDLEFQPSD